ncbi:hypothetical protein, partial [Caballeronia sordidicola]|uniref:hypothetical protein n=1 Tax=Caballeronia sordidicola TaxID=196367 RepID=UPI001C4E8721
HNAYKGNQTMTKRTRRMHSAAFKATLALAGVRGECTLGEFRRSLTIIRTNHGVEAAIARTGSRRGRCGRRPVDKPAVGLKTLTRRYAKWGWRTIFHMVFS